MQEHEISVLCEDGPKLAGTLFIPTEEVKSAVMVAPATGIRRQFYKGFAKHLCEYGHVVLTFDNRGIGGSKGANINASDPSLTKWGLLDMTAVLEYLKSKYPDTSYHLVGHSAGGQLAGLMKNAKDLTSMFNFGSSSGSLKYSRFPFRLKSSFYLNVYIPLSNLIFGHTKSQWVGMGEPLPKEVGREWSRWCSGTGYVAVDLNTRIKEHYYDELVLDSLWVHAKDDEIANYENVKDMIRVYPKINYQILTLDPADYGYGDIGHMKFFSSKRNTLWSLATDWLDEHTS